MGDINLGRKINNLDEKVDENAKSIANLNTKKYFKSQCTLVSQSDYEVTIEEAILFGNIALMTVSIKSLTQESYPTGQTWKPIITLPFKNMGILTKTINSRNGDYKQIEISCNNSNQVFVRGGSVDSTYTDTILLLK